MALPLPAPVQLGGDIVGASSAINALRQSNLENKIKAIEAQYAPITVPARAASQWTYANLMGPQFLAKFMGNPEILANLTEQQRNQGKDIIYNSGVGQGIGTNFFNNLPQIKDESLFGILKNKLGSMIGGEQPQYSQQGMQQPTQNRIMQNPMLTQQDRSSISNLQPGQAYTIPANQSTQAAPEIPSRGKNWFERTAEAKGIESAGTEAGKLRAQDIQELNTTAFNANTMQSTLNELSNIVNTPEFRQIRQIPIAGQHEMGWYAKFGTPEQKRMIGNFLAEQGQVVVNAASQFKGAFRIGEQSLINTMKVNPSDMPDVAVGKINAMSLMNQMLAQRTSITARLMEDHHLSKGKAMEIADKQIDGNAIRKQLDNSIMITIKNKKTGQKMTIPLTQAKEMGVPNV